MPLFEIKIEKVVVHQNDELLKEILSEIRIVNNKIDTFMATSQERFDALMTRLNTVTNDIAADYRKLLQEIQNNNVSQASLEAAEANIAKLEELGASVENPVPEPPTEPQG